MGHELSLIADRAAFFLAGIHPAVLDDSGAPGCSGPYGALLDLGDYYAAGDRQGSLAFPELKDCEFQK